MARSRKHSNSRSRYPEKSYNPKDSLTAMGAHNTMMKKTVNIEFATVLGTDKKFLQSDVPAPTGATYNHATTSRVTGAYPGIMTLKFHPTFGISRSSSDPVNVAAKNYFAKIRSKGNYSVDWESTDLIMYFMYVSQLYNLHALGTRTYGCLLRADAWNRYIGDAEIVAAGFDPVSWRANNGDIPGWFDYWAQQIKRFKVPKEVEFFSRQFDMVSHIYVDETDVCSKHQEYIWTPSGYWTYDYNSATDKYELNYNRFTSAMTWSAYQTLMNSLIDRISEDYDFNQISANVLNAYGDSVLTVLEPDFGYTVEAHLDDMMGNMINNITALYAPVAWTNDTIAEATTPGFDPYLVYDPTLPTDTPFAELHRTITIPKNEPDDADIINALRCTAIAGVVTYNGAAPHPFEYKFNAMPTEFVERISIYRWREVSGVWTLGVQDYDSWAAAASTFAGYMTEATTFRFYPPQTQFSRNSDTFSVVAHAQILDNYGYVDERHLSDITNRGLATQMGL